MEIVRRRDRKVRKVWVGGEGSYTHTYACYLSSVSISINKGLNSNVEQKKKKKTHERSECNCSRCDKVYKRNCDVQHLVQYYLSVIITDTASWTFLFVQIIVEVHLRNVFGFVLFCLCVLCFR